MSQTNDVDRARRAGYEISDEDAYAIAMGWMTLEDVFPPEDVAVIRAVEPTLNAPKEILVEGGGRGVTGGEGTGRDPAAEAAAAEEAAIRRKIVDLMNGVGIQSGDEIYAGVKPTIDAQAYNLAGAQASDLASKGLSRSGWQQRSVANVAQQHGTALSQAKTASDQQSTQMKNDSFATGYSMLNSMDDLAQRGAMLAQMKEERAKYDKENNPEDDWFNKFNSESPVNKPVIDWLGSL